MKNFAEKATTALAIGIATLGNADAKAMEAYGKLEVDTGKNLSALRTEIPAKKINTKVLNITDFRTDVLQNVSTESRPFDKLRTGENLETEPPSIKDIIAAAKDLKGEALVSYIESNGITKEYLQEKMDAEEGKYNTYNGAWILRQREINKINGGHSDENQIDKDTDSEMLSLDKSRDFHENQRMNLAIILKAYVTHKNIPIIAAAAAKDAKNFAENGKTLEQIEDGSDLDKGLKALGMELSEKVNTRGSIDTYVTIDGQKIKVVNGRGFDEYKILLTVNNQERIIAFKMISGVNEDDAGAIYYTEFRENSKEQQVEEWGKQPKFDFDKNATYNKKPIIDTTTGTKTAAVNKPL